jgi:hypothetical protein
MSEAIEITTFKLKGGSCADFIAANADVDAWLRRQPGFLGRWIAERDDGTIVDTLIWASVADGERSAQGIMTELAHSPVHGLIDQGTVEWTIAPIRHQVGAGKRP